MPVVTASDGVPVAVHDFGGDGPPLVMVHATGFHGMVWRPVADRLRDRFRCVAFDERGHGDSGVPPDGNFSWRGFARDVLAVVEELGLVRPFAVGHSLGGAALLLAEQAAPGTFRALWCYEPIVPPLDPPPGPRPDNPLAKGARRRREVFDSRDAAYANYAAKPPLCELAPPVLRAYVDHGFADRPDGTVRLKCRRDSEAAVYANSFEHDAYARLAEVACPVTLACGELTDAFGEPVMRQLAARLLRSTLLVMRGLGHFGPMQDPTAVAGAVARAFAGEAGAGAGPGAD